MSEALALSDILEVIPLPAVRAAMPSMSSRGLKNAAVRATAIDRLFNNNVVRPMQMKRFSCDNNVVSRKIVPGSQLRENGTINLDKLSGLGSPLLTVTRPDDGLPRNRHISRRSVLFCLSRLGGEILVLVSESYISFK